MRPHRCVVSIHSLALVNVQRHRITPGYIHHVRPGNRPECKHWSTWFASAWFNTWPHLGGLCLYNNIVLHSHYCESTKVTNHMIINTEWQHLCRVCHVSKHTVTAEHIRFRVGFGTQGWQTNTHRELPYKLWLVVSLLHTSPVRPRKLCPHNSTLFNHWGWYTTVRVAYHRPWFRI
jgi:hypothetical protein